MATGPEQDKDAALLDEVERVASRTQCWQLIGCPSHTDVVKVDLAVARTHEKLFLL